jgi:hypothetical protein
MIRAIHLLVIASLTLLFAAAASDRAEAGSLIEIFSAAFASASTAFTVETVAPTVFSSYVE